MEVLRVLLVLAAIIAAFGLLTGGLAARKGYDFGSWFFVPPLLALIVLAFLPHANTPGLSRATAARRIARGDRVGAALTGLSLLSFTAALLNLFFIA